MNKLKYLVITLAALAFFYWCLHSNTRINVNSMIYKAMYVNKVLNIIENYRYKIDYEKFNHIIEYYDEKNLKSLLAKVEYKTEIIDCSSIPALVLARGYGDCDDYSRLSALVLHRSFFRVYILDMYRLNEKSGHSICIGINNEQVIVVDNILVSATPVTFYCSDNTIINMVMDMYTPDIFVVNDMGRNIKDIQWMYNEKR